GDEPRVSGYAKTLSSGCSGTIANGESKTCTLTNYRESLEVAKSGALNLGNDGVATPNDLITYSFEVTNTGEARLDNISVTDPLPDLSAINCGGQTSLDP